MGVARQVPPEFLQQQVRSLHQGACPRCGGPGPVGLHNNFRVWSILVLTSWSNRPQVCCRRCATRLQLGGALFSGVFGWWGFPWGIILTPIMVGRNLGGIFGGPKPGCPSAGLERIVRLSLAARLAQQNAVDRPPPLPQAGA